MSFSAKLPPSSRVSWTLHRPGKWLVEREITSFLLRRHMWCPNEFLHCRSIAGTIKLMPPGEENSGATPAGRARRCDRPTRLGQEAFGEIKELEPRMAVTLQGP
jgi:hypothetical protein